MNDIRTYKRKLILNRSQQQRIDAWIDTCRFVYNMALEIQIAAYRNKQIMVNKYALMAEIKYIRDVDWIKDVPTMCLYSVIKRLDQAYGNFFRTYRSGGGKPKFALKAKFKSIHFKDVSVSGRNLKLTKLGNIRMFKDSEIIGNPKTATIVKDPTGYFVCITCDNVPSKFISENQAIGLDVGIVNLYTDSNGYLTENPKHFVNYERKLRVESRSLSRKKKGSNSWKKQANKLVLLHHKIGNARKDFLHKESTKIAKKCNVVYIEDLKVGNMVKNKRLSKHILDCGWYMFRSMLAYKTCVVAINPKHTSQTCSVCGTVDAKSRVSQSIFVCSSCGHESHADVNAALNILSKGIALDRERKAIA